MAGQSDLGQGTLPEQYPDSTSHHPQKAEISRHMRREKPEGMEKDKALSYFPVRARNSTPLSKIAILQRLLVSLPFSRLALSVQIFSEDAEHWWYTCGAGAEGAITAASPPPNKTAKPSVTALAKRMKELELTKGYPEAEKPDVSRVKKVVRHEGVDGLRRLRNDPDAELADTEVLNAIEVDDGASTCVREPNLISADSSPCSHLDRRSSSQMGRYRNHQSRLLDLLAANRHFRLAELCSLSSRHVPTRLRCRDSPHMSQQAFSRTRSVYFQLTSSPSPS